MSGAITTNKNNITPLSPIQELAKVKLNKNRPLTGIVGNVGSNYNIDYLSNKVIG